MLHRGARSGSPAASAKCRSRAAPGRRPCQCLLPPRCVRFRAGGRGPADRSARGRSAIRPLSRAGPARTLWASNVCRASGASTDTIWISVTIRSLSATLRRVKSSGWNWRKEWGTSRGRAAYRRRAGRDWPAAAGYRGQVVAVGCDRNRSIQVGAEDLCAGGLQPGHRVGRWMSVGIAPARADDGDARVHAVQECVGCGRATAVMGDLQHVERQSALRQRALQQLRVDLLFDVAAEQEPSFPYCISNTIETLLTCVPPSLG